MRKEVLYVSNYLEETEFKENEFKLFSRLGAEGCLEVLEGEGGIWVSKHPLPDLDYSLETDQVDRALYELGYTVDCVKQARPDLFKDF